MGWASSIRRLHRYTRAAGGTGTGAEHRRQIALGSIVILSVSLYQPITTWARNPWDFASPGELTVLGLAVFSIGMLPYLVAVAFGLRPLPVALMVAGLLAVLLRWNEIDILTPIWWATLILVVVVASYRWLSGRTQRRLSYVVIAIAGIAPIVQVAIAHVAQSETYPIVELSPHEAGTATGLVEDVVLVVVDSYPGPAISEDWLDHDSTFLTDRLEDLGYTVSDNALSQHTYTGLAVSSILELQPITTPDIARPWGNRTSTYHIIRGDNLVAATLQSAGFHYTHLDSGWDAGACGGAVDRCLAAPFLKEVTWEFLRPTIIGNWLTERFGAYSVGSTIEVARNLVDLAPIIGDGNHDYVYAHMLLPHPPVVADSECRPDVPDRTAVISFDPENPGREDRDRFDAQLTCVDSLLDDVAAIAGPTTAIVITGDHGTSTNGQIGTSAVSWSDSDIAERLSILLAYRLPSGCEPPTFETNIEAMRAVMVCATDIAPPSNNGMFLIEATNPAWVEPSRMTSIIERLAAHQIDPEPFG